MKKLTLEHIAPYLPYSLEIYTEYYDKIVTAIGVKNNSILCGDYISSKGGAFDQVDFNSAKPLLRPMSDLIKPIIVEGYNESREFIPAIELAKLTVEIYPLQRVFVDKKGGVIFDYKIVKKPFGNALKVANGDAWVVYLSFTSPLKSKAFIIQQLFKWHFDVFGLIEKDLAIDMNTLNK